MNPASTAAGEPRDWRIPIFDRVGLAPFWLGLGFAFTLVCLFVIFHWATGVLTSLSWQGRPFLQSSLFWFEVLQALMIGYAPTAAVYLRRGALRDLEDLRPGLELSETDYQRERRALSSLPPSYLIWVTLIAAPIGLGVPQFDASWAFGRRPPLGDPMLTWAMLRTFLMFWLYTRTVYIDIYLAVRLSRVTLCSASIDLLDLSSLSPLARNGLRSVALWVVLSVFIGLMFLAPWTSVVNTGSALAIFAVAVAALLLPAWGGHNRARKAKVEELGRVRKRIRAERERLLAGQEASPNSTLANLLAYESRIQNVNTWPFDISTLLRFSLYVALGVGSWLGAALVERLLDRALN